jgi:hypothetical protein
MCNSKQQRTCKKTAFHSQGIEHHGSFESIGSPRTWHLCHWNLKPFWQCFKEACWGLLPSPVCKFAQSMSVYIFMGNPTELQKAWRQAPCATFVMPIVDKKVVGMSSLTHETLLFHDTSAESLQPPPTLIINHFCSCIQLFSNHCTPNYLSAQQPCILFIELVCPQFQKAAKCKIVEPLWLLLCSFAHVSICFHAVGYHVAPNQITQHLSSFPSIHIKMRGWTNVCPCKTQINSYSIDPNIQLTNLVAHVATKSSTIN